MSEEGNIKVFALLKAIIR